MTKRPANFKVTYFNKILGREITAGGFASMRDAQRHADKVGGKAGY